MGGLEQVRAEVGAGETLWWVHAGWGFGAVITDEKGVIVDSAPILRKLRGLWVEGLPRHYRVEKVKRGS
jgi:hypothetical protein